MRALAMACYAMLRRVRNCPYIRPTTTITNTATKCQDLGDANHKKLRGHLTQINKLKQKHVFKFSSPPAERTVIDFHQPND